MIRALFLCLALLAPPAQAATIPATVATLQAVLAHAQGGDVIVTSAEAYPAVRINGLHPASPVTLDMRASTVQALSIINASHWSIQQGEFGPCVYACIQVLASDHVSVDRVHCADAGTACITLSDVTDFALTYTHCSRMLGDCIDVASSQRGDIEDTVNVDNVRTPIHPDTVQLWSIVGHAPVAYITVRRSTAIGDTQGVDLFDHGTGGGDHITFDDNSIASLEVWGVAANAVTNSRMTNNHMYTLLGDPNQVRAILTDNAALGGADSGKTNVVSGNVQGAIPSK